MHHENLLCFITNRKFTEFDRNTKFPDHSVMVSLIYFSSYLLSHPLFILKIKVQYPLGIFVLFFEIYGQPHESTLYIGYIN